MAQYFFANGNEQRGPYTLEELASLGLRPDTLVWHEGLTEWQRADSLPEWNVQVGLAQRVQAAQGHPPPGGLTQNPASGSVEPQVNDSPAQLNYQINPTIPTEGMAIASLVLGLISIPALCAYGLGIIPGILAVVFGFIARSRIRRGQVSGAGIALAGLILGFISAGLVVAFFVVVIIIGLVAAMK